MGEERAVGARGVRFQPRTWILLGGPVLLSMAIFLRVHAAGEPAEEPLNQTGNCNSDSRLDISDPIYLLDYLFGAGPAPECDARCQFNSDHHLDMADAIAILNFLMRGLGATVPLVEKCDGIDNNCDGVIDEDCAPLTSIDLAWDPVNQDIRGHPELIAGYRVYMGRSGLRKDYVLIKEVAPDCACFTLEASLLPAPTGKTCYLAVTAIDLNDNESDFSSALLITW